MECKFFVGQRVVCVNPLSDGRPLDGLAKGAVYTIRKLGVASVWDDRTGEPMVWLEEIYREYFIGPSEPGFHHTRFRPATDIGNLEALLNTKPADVPEEELV